MSNINRIEWIDTVKGIAIILIILEHTTCIDSKYIGIIFTQMTLPAFFALSGYFLRVQHRLNRLFFLRYLH